jgi:hypothetical protein
MILEPYDAKDLAYALSNTNDDRYIKLDSYDGTSTGEEYILLPNGELKSISNIESVIKHKQAIIDRVLDNMKSTCDIVDGDYISIKMNERDKLGSLVKDNPDLKLEYISTCTQLTSAYIITGYKLDEIKNDEKANEKIMDAIREERKKEIEEEENDKEIANELDLVNAMLKEIIPKEKRVELQIESCKYNDESIDPVDLTTKLSNHMLPEFMTQVNILDTLEDHYEIVTNTCIITRAKGGEITIKER